MRLINEKPVTVANNKNFVTITKIRNKTSLKEALFGYYE